MKTVYPTKTIFDFFKETDNFASIQKQIDQLNALKRELEKILPKHYHPYFHPSLTQQGVLLLFVENNLLAAKLRQFTPSIIKQLKTANWSVEQIKIKLLPRQQNVCAQEKRTQLSKIGLTELYRLSLSLTDSPLKEAIDNMVTRHTG